MNPSAKAPSGDSNPSRTTSNRIMADLASCVRPLIHLPLMRAEPARFPPGPTALHGRDNRGRIHPAAATISSGENSLATVAPRAYHEYRLASRFTQGLPMSFATELA